MEGYLATVSIFAGNFAPRGWTFCAGQLVAIASNTALFALLGTTYGGDGKATFALPDLRSRVVIGQGTGPGLHPYILGQQSGTQTNQLLQSNMPPHIHTTTVTAKLQVNGDSSNTENPDGAYFGAAPNQFYNDTAGAGQFLHPFKTSGTVGNAGGASQMNNLQPFLATSYIICMQGIFPSRN